MKLAKQDVLTQAVEIIILAPHFFPSIIQWYWSGHEHFYFWDLAGRSWVDDTI